MITMVGCGLILAISTHKTLPADRNRPRECEYPCEPGNYLAGALPSSTPPSADTANCALKIQITGSPLKQTALDYQPTDFVIP